MLQTKGNQFILVAFLLLNTFSESTPDFLQQKSLELQILNTIKICTASILQQSAQEIHANRAVASHKQIFE